MKFLFFNNSINKLLLYTRYSSHIVYCHFRSVAMNKSPVNFTSRSYYRSKANVSAFPVPVVQRKAVVVDGLNIFTRLRAFQIEQLSENNKKRKANSLFYQSKEEVVNDVEYIYSFFRSVFDDDVDIHFVLKKYGEKHMDFWYVLADSLIDIFGDRFNFRLYCALAMDNADKECDDRFALRLGLKLQSENNSVYILSQDKFRSINNHWSLDSEYYELTNTKFPIHNIRYIDYDIYEIKNLRFIQYEYYVNRDNIKMDIIM